VPHREYAYLQTPAGRPAPTCATQDIPVVTPRCNNPNRTSRVEWPRAQAKDREPNTRAERPDFLRDSLSGVNSARPDPWGTGETNLLGLPDLRFAPGLNARRQCRMSVFGSPAACDHRCARQCTHADSVAITKMFQRSLGRKPEPARLEPGISAVNESLQSSHSNEAGTVAIPIRKPGDAGDGAVVTPLRSRRYSQRSLGRKREPARLEPGISTVSESLQSSRSNEAGTVAIPIGKPGDTGDGAVVTPLRSRRSSQRSLGRKPEPARLERGINAVNRLLKPFHSNQS
jgi:hypothetical protein